MNSADDDRLLADLRQRIRQADQRILEWVAERSRVARDIGERKRELGLPVKNFQVEKEVAQRNQQMAHDLGLDEHFVENLTRILIGHSVQTQDALGPEAQGSHSGQRVLIVGGRGGMGRWLTDFFASCGHTTSIHDQAEEQADAHALERAATNVDVIVLSTPIGATAPLIARLAAARTRALIFDICSLKSPLLAAIATAQQQGIRIASLHPMFGPGARQLAGRNLIVCDCGDPEAATAAGTFFASTPVRITTMTLKEHDELMGLVLGLSHLSNLVFAEALRLSGQPLMRLAQVASTTFNAQMQVTMPVSSENQDLYFEIQAQNAATPQVLTHLEQAMANYRQAILSADRDHFVHIMESGRRYLMAQTLAVSNFQEPDQP